MPDSNIISFLTINCRGLQNYGKRKDMFDVLRKKENNIICLQDTHFASKEEKIVRSQWGAEHYFSPGRTNARGVSILLSNNFEFKIIDIIKDDIGNLLALKINLENHFTLSLINIYGPNNENPDFFNKIRDAIDAFMSDFIVLCGDWNLVLNPDIDYFNYNSVNNPKK